MHQCFKLFDLPDCKIIKQLSAALLLLLFLVGNTPKQWLHNIFANHTDYKKDAALNNDIAGIYKLRYHCQCDQPVIESPFVISVSAFTLSKTRQYLAYQSPPYVFVNTNHPVHFSLRGPPTVNV